MIFEFKFICYEHPLAKSRPHPKNTNATPNKKCGIDTKYMILKSRKIN